MEIAVPYEYITVILFSINLAYENRKVIKYATLKDIYKTILEEVLDNYRNKNFEKIYFLKDRWEKEPKFQILPFFVVINNILNKYPNLFEAYNNDSLKFKNSAKYEDLIVAITEIEQHTKGIQRFYDAAFSDKVFEILNIKRIKNILTKYLDIERIIENDYLHNLEILPKHLFMREIFLYDIGTFEEEKIDAFRHTALKLRKTLNYEELPIDYEIWKNSEFYVSPEEDKDGSIMYDIIPQLKSLYQYAIFGTESLAEFKLSSLLNFVDLIVDDEEDEEFDDIEAEIMDEEEAHNMVSAYEETIEVSEDAEEEDDESDYEYGYSSIILSTVEDIFFTTYLYELNNYLKNNYTPNLDLTRNRLLYSLDDGELELYKEENILKEYEESKLAKLEESDFDFLMVEAIFFCDEVFQSKINDNTIKKLLFIKTYYTLTHDNELKDIFKKYKDRPEYYFYSTIVFGNTLDNTLKRNLEEN